MQFAFNNVSIGICFQVLRDECQAGDLTEPQVAGRSGIYYTQEA